MPRGGGIEITPQRICFAAQALQIGLAGRRQAFHCLQGLQALAPGLGPLMHLRHIRLQAASVILDKDILQDAPALRGLAQGAGRAAGLALFQQRAASLQAVGEAGQAGDQLAALGAGIQGEEMAIQFAGWRWQLPGQARANGCQLAQGIQGGAVFPGIQGQGLIGKAQIALELRAGIQGIEEDCRQLLALVCRDLLQALSQAGRALVQQMGQAGVDGAQQFTFIAQALASLQLFAQAVVALADQLLQGGAVTGIDQQIEQADTQFGDIQQPLASRRQAVAA